MAVQPRASGPQGGDVELKSLKRREAEGEEMMVSSARLEPSTLPWNARLDQGGGDKGVTSMSVASLPRERSHTESELHVSVRERQRDDDDEEENRLPDEAGQVFRPAVLVPSPSLAHDRTELWHTEPDNRPFLASHQVPAADGYYQEWLEERSAKRGQVCTSREVLKVGVALFTAVLLFPFLVWGGFVFLPFDAPLLNSAPLRLVYTLRCSVFATVPIILGWLVLGVSRMRTGQVAPLPEGGEGRDVAVHRRFVADSTALFLIYFLQLVVMAMYVNQDLLKLVPLLTIVFALGRLVYWPAAALGSSVRGFGFGLSFLPSLVMLAVNLYFIFTVDASGSFFVEQEQPQDPPTRNRFWG